MLVERLVCGICGKKMYANLGMEVCPFCKTYGCLQYIDDEEQAEEFLHDMKNSIWVAEVDNKYYVGKTEEEAIVSAFGEEETQFEFYSADQFYYEEIKKED